MAWWLWAFTVLGENPLLAPSISSDDSVPLTTERRQEKQILFSSALAS